MYNFITPPFSRFGVGSSVRVFFFLVVCFEKKLVTLKTIEKV